MTDVSCPFHLRTVDDNSYCVITGGIMDNKYIFQWVDIDSIQFVNNRNDIMFEFSNCSPESVEYCGSLTCINILSLNIVTGFDDDADVLFPQYVIDVYIENQTEGNGFPIKVMLQGGPYDITVICKEIQIKKP